MAPVIIPALTWRQVMVRWDCSDTESARNSVQASHTPSPVTPWPEPHTTHWAPLSFYRETVVRGQSQGDCFQHYQERNHKLLTSHLLCPLLCQEEPLVPAPPAEHVTVGHVLALLAPGRGVVERGVPVLEAGLQQAVPVLLLHTTQQLNSWSCSHPPTNLA